MDVWKTDAACLGSKTEGRKFGAVFRVARVFPTSLLHIPLLGSHIFRFMNLTKHWAGMLEDYVIDLAWSPDGALLAAAASCGPVTVFRPAAEASAAGARLCELPGHGNGTNCLAWMPSGSAALLTTGGQDGKVKFWDAASGQHTGSADFGNAWVEHLAWRPAQPPGAGGQAADLLLAVAAGRELCFLNPDASIRQRCKPAPKTVSAIAWEPSGGALAAAHFGGVQIWDADDFLLQKEFQYNNGIHALVWSPDARWLVSGNQDPSVHLWMPETGVELHMSGYEGKVTALAFDCDSRWLATGGGVAACVWNCSGATGPEGREPDQLEHPARVCALAFQHKHGLLASASEDGSVMIWSLDRSSPLRATIKMPAAASKLAWSPDDEYLAIGSEKGALYVLKCMP